MATSAYHYSETYPWEYHSASRLRSKWEKAQRIRGLAGSIGLANTTRIIWDRFIGDGQEHFITPHPKSLRFPVHMTTRRGDALVYHEVINDEVYRLPDDIRAEINGKPIVDIGANIGLAAIYFASRYPDSPVTAIEPHPRNYRILDMNAGSYGDQITVMKAALGAQPGDIGSVNTEGDPDNHVAHLFTDRYVEAAASEVVSPALTGEDIAGRLADLGRIGLLKIDIEGAEKEVFESYSVHPLLEQTDLLMIETHDRYVPGSSRAVRNAAAANGLHQSSPDGGHTTIYSR
jgi:FkbM family methyltransferase